MAKIDVKGSPVEFEQSGEGPQLLLLHSLLTELTVFARVAPVLARTRRVTMALGSPTPPSPEPATTSIPVGTSASTSMALSAAPSNASTTTAQPRNRSRTLSAVTRAAGRRAKTN